MFTTSPSIYFFRSGLFWSDLFLHINDQALEVYGDIVYFYLYR